MYVKICIRTIHAKPHPGHNMRSVPSRNIEIDKWKNKKKTFKSVLTWIDSWIFYFGALRCDHVLKLSDDDIAMCLRPWKQCHNYSSNRFPCLFHTASENENWWFLSTSCTSQKLNFIIIIFLIIIIIGSSDVLNVLDVLKGKVPETIRWRKWKPSAVDQKF